VAALAKIKDLEDRLSKKAKEDIDRAKALRRPPKRTAGNDIDVQHLLSVAEAEGPEAALAWARSAKRTVGGAGPLSSPSRPASRTGFNTGGMGMMGTGMGIGPSESPLRRVRIANRTPKPLPSALSEVPGVPGQGEPPVATEKRLLRRFKEAVEYVPFEFSSDLATYTVHRPYGFPTHPGLFAHCRPAGEPENAYPMKAHIADKTAIEVAAVTKADNTPVLVFGSAGIRYQTNPNESASGKAPPNWKHFDDVDALDRPLGHITYIDSMANEKEYSLDEVLEEALLVREQYCGTVTSTALALERDGRPSERQQQQQQTQPQESQKPPRSDSRTKEQAPAAGTDAPKNAPQKAPEKPKPTPRQVPAEDAGADSSDVLVAFLGMVFSFFFRLVWGTFVQTPLRIVQTTIVLIASWALIQTLFFYLADGYNEWALREMASAAGGSSSMVASDLVWYSNQHPGIL